MATVLEKDCLILADLTANNNKWYRIERLDDHSVVANFGRVGVENGQTVTKSFISEWAARKFYEAKIREKEKKGYRPVQAIESGQTVTRTVTGDVAELARREIRYSSSVVEQLVHYLATKNIHQILNATTMTYDNTSGTFSTPLGVVTATGISHARSLLANIAILVQSNAYDTPGLTEMVNNLLMLVPQDIGRRRLTVQDLFPGEAAIAKQSALLDALDAAVQQVTVTTDDGGAVAPSGVFDVALELVEDGNEIDRIRRKFRETAQTRHEASVLDVDKVYLVEIGAMRRAFAKDGAKVGNVWELWHGTRVGNLLSIMKGGFQIPPASASHCSGRVFGNGIYHSDQSTKSLNYAYGYWDGGSRDHQCFMFLNNVAMGTIYYPRGSHESLPKPGYDSTFAEGGKAGVLNNEMIVYETSRIDPVFLIQFGRKK
jgi:poly [ADP-ribose] polymerase